MNSQSISDAGTLREENWLHSVFGPISFAQWPSDRSKPSASKPFAPAVEKDLIAEPIAVEASEPFREILLQLDHQAAKEVLLIGSFTAWDEEPVSMERNAEGLWQASILLPPGRYYYRFLADGEWQDDPRARQWRRLPSGVRDNVLEIN